ncbi:O-antigen ligase family protein [Sediminibacterium ginsengisoli]|uniref:O-antigen ligase like membrane protein n=1 Tax=Sediminibacterium ginsengisoli TaxID=413434 RepID=A0A1T4N3B3_9BACT|nr:O-antigen ligase family protein [Sediminibacterium ginsengisoli]SJZ73712.1 hypothetical protein SAMN04488132_10472 [Sediminibacterium ginsengisoli]
MFLFPCIYITAFFTAIYKLANNKQDGILFFIIFGLPIYITSLSISHMYGLGKIIPVLQILKEVTVLIALLVFVSHHKKKIRLTTADWLVLSYAAYNLLYIVLPLGTYSITEKMIAYKSVSFFPFVYFAGRFCDPRQINLNKWFSYLCLVAIATGIVLLFEIVPYQHFQTYTGYAEYNAVFLNVEPAGNYGLTWTFESINGIKRFASFFSMPLEHAAATLISVSVLAALATDRKNRFRLNKLLLVTFLFTLLSISFAFSRAAFASYFLMIYVYILITRNRTLLLAIHWGIALAVLAVLVWLEGDIYEVIATTIDFSDSSSASHVIEWITGLQAIGANPFGLGLGSSGRIAGSFGENIGGENQFIIIGVQTGVIAVGLYIAAYATIIRKAFQAFRTSASLKARRLGLMLVLLKVGLIIPFLTSEVETYLYISYFTWFFSGMLINIITPVQEQKSVKNK